MAHIQKTSALPVLMGFAQTGVLSFEPTNDSETLRWSRFTYCLTKPYNHGKGNRLHA